MKFCCGITLFYPSKKELAKIETYLSVFEHIYIYDNTDSQQQVINKKQFDGNSAITYYSTGKNDGLSLAYNKMCKSALNNKFQYICLFDQDSNIDVIKFEKMKDAIIADKDEKVAIYVPLIIYGNKASENNENKNELTEVKWEISSGSFINLEVYKNTNGFDENYFIDRLDYDYCFFVRKLGYKIKRVNYVHLYQRLGEECTGIFKGKGQHSALRHYYIFRNRLYFNFKYYNSIKAVTLSVLQMSKHIFSITFFEDNKINKYGMGYLALKDYSNKKMEKKGGAYI